MRTSILASAFVHSLKNQPTRRPPEMPVRPQSEVNEVERTYTLIQYTLRTATCILYTVVLTEEGLNLDLRDDQIDCDTSCWILTSILTISCDNKIPRKLSSTSNHRLLLEVIIISQIFPIKTSEVSFPFISTFFSVLSYV